MGTSVSPCALAKKLDGVSKEKETEAASRAKAGRCRLTLSNPR
jgi:hypothetical protein